MPPPRRPEAFTAPEPPATVVRVRSNNAVATVRIVPAEATAERLRQLQQPSGEVTRDVLDDLRTR